MKYFITIQFFLMTALPIAGAATVRHTLLPNDSSFTVETQSACSTYLMQPSPHWCNPALFPFTNESSIKTDLALSADQNAYETTSRFINEPIYKEFIEHLFREQNFQSFSGFFRLEALSSYLSFSYIPLHVIGAYQLFNPNLPEVSAAGMRQSVLRVTSGTLLNQYEGWALYGGGSIHAFDRKSYYVHANALEIILKDVSTLIESKHTKGINIDTGVFLKNVDDKWPSFSVQGENILAPQEKKIGKSHLLDLDSLFRRRFEIGSGYTLTHQTGSYHIGINLPFWDTFRVFDKYSSTVAFAYGIGRLRAFTSFSPLMTAFGFIFMSSYYHVGIQYTDDKQDNNVELRRRKNVYLFTSFNF